MTAVDVEDLHTTRSERLLALVMLAFLLIGTVWAYQELDDRVRSSIELGAPPPEDAVALQRRADAERRVGAAANAVARARDEVGFRREEYRAALDAGRPAAELERRYRAAQAALAEAQAERQAAAAALAAARPAAAAASRRESERLDERRDRQVLVTFLLRLGLVGATLGAGYWLLAALRNRGSRYLPLAAAVLACGTILALALTVDYLTDWFDPLDAGVLVLSLLGAGATLASFWALQRYLARRLPQRRVRRGECPFCAYPVRENERCEGCGRAVVAPCARCERPRRVGTPHCGACGQA